MLLATIIMFAIGFNLTVVHGFQGSQISDPLASKPVTIDGKWTTSDEWSDASVTVMPAYIGSVMSASAFLYSKHDNSSFYFLIDFVSATSLSVSDDYASITIDPTHDDGASAQPDDFRFDSQYPTGGYMSHGGLSLSFPLPSGVLIAMSMGTSSNFNQPHEITEFSIPFLLFTAMHNTIGFRATAAHGSGDSYGAVSWPTGSVPNLPRTWGELTLSPTPILPSLSSSSTAQTTSATSISTTKSLLALQTPSTQVGASVVQTQSTQSTGLVMPSGNLGLIGIGAIVALVASVLVVVRRRKPQAAVTKEQPTQGLRFRRGAAPVQPTIATGYPDLDDALKGGIPEGFAVVIVSASYDERDLLLRRIAEASLSSGRSAFYISNDLARTQDMITRYPKGLYVFSSQSDKTPSHSSNLYKIPGIENLSDANISLNIAIKDACAKDKASKPVMIIDTLSDLLLRHKSVTTRRWLSDFVSRHKTDGFTVIASLNPLIGTRDEVESVVDFFDGVFEIYEKPLQERTRRFLVVKKMYGRDYSDNELLLDRRKLI